LETFFPANLLVSTEDPLQSNQSIKCHYQTSRRNVQRDYSLHIRQIYEMVLECSLWSHDEYRLGQWQYGCRQNTSRIDLMFSMKWDTKSPKNECSYLAYWTWQERLT